jgi:hypothetical protein
MAEPQKPVDTFQVTKLIWGALLASQVMYAFVLFQVICKDVPPADYRWFPNLSDPFERAITIVALVVGAMSIAIPSALAKKTVRGEETDESAKPLRLLPSLIVRLALFEAIVLFGFLLGIHARNPGLIAPFLAVSAILYLKNFPSDPAKVRSDLGA